MAYFINIVASMLIPTCPPHIAGHHQIRSLCLFTEHAQVVQKMDSTIENALCTFFFYLSVNVFSTEVLIGDTILTSPT